jgi:5-methyltetrahydropteroyltriglutamate--homocysteine methyltransferase
MKRSVDSILTTHAGSLPRPDALRDAWSKPIETPEGAATLDALLRQSVMTVVADQLMAGIAIPNDGEFGKPMHAASGLAAWRTYVFGRLTGFGPAPPGAAAPARTAASLMTELTRSITPRWRRERLAVNCSAPAVVVSWHL